MEVMAHDSNARQRRYPPELRERAVRLVAETAAERGDRHGAVTDVARQQNCRPIGVLKFRAIRWANVPGACSQPWSSWLTDSKQRQSTRSKKA
jgi:hypothetical protein